MSNVEVTTVVRNTLSRHLGPALVGEFVNRTTTFVTSFYLDRQSTVTDKVKRVRLLLFKIHSVIEAAEAVMPIGNLSLCRWLIELQDAAREGDDLLLIFKLRYQEDPLQTVGHRGFFLSSLWEAFQKAVRAATDLFWHDYDVDRLTGSLDRLEKISSDVGSFLALLELDSRRRDKRIGGCNGVAKEANPCSLSYGVLLKEAEVTHMSEAEETTDRTKGSMLRLHQARGHHHDHH
ncbi:uncharacterized protein LOC144572831 [Carex rostrata]